MVPIRQTCVHIGYRHSGAHHQCHIARLYLGSTCSRHDPDIICSLSLGPVTLLTATSLLMPYELVGVGVGLHTCANNIGTTILSLMVGYLQDSTFHDGDASDDHVDLQHEYDYVMIFYLLVSCCIALLLAFLFWFWDKQLTTDQPYTATRETRIKADRKSA